MPIAGIACANCAGNNWRPFHLIRKRLFRNRELCKSLTLRYFMRRFILTRSGLGKVREFVNWEFDGLSVVEEAAADIIALEEARRVLNRGRIRTAKTVADTSVA